MSPVPGSVCPSTALSTRISVYQCSTQCQDQCVPSTESEVQNSLTINQRVSAVEKKSEEAESGVEDNTNTLDNEEEAAPPVLYNSKTHSSVSIEGCKKS